MTSETGCNLNAHKFNANKHSRISPFGGKGRTHVLVDAGAREQRSKVARLIVHATVVVLAGGRAEEGPQRRHGAAQCSRFWEETKLGERARTESEECWGEERRWERVWGITSGRCWKRNQHLGNSSLVERNWSRALHSIRTITAHQPRARTLDWNNAGAAAATFSKNCRRDWTINEGRGQKSVFATNNAPTTRPLPKKEKEKKSLHMHAH